MPVTIPALGAQPRRVLLNVFSRAMWQVAAGVLVGSLLSGGAFVAIGVDLSKRYQNVGEGEVGEGEIPVFWACGLTPQLAVKNAKPPFCITHAPSSMLITDLRNASLAVL